MEVNIGPKEQKVVDLMDKIKARIEKKLSQLQKDNPKAYEIAKKYVDENTAVIDEAWDIIGRDPEFKGTRKLIDTILSTRSFKYPRDKFEDLPINLYNYTDDRSIVDTIDDANLWGYPNYVGDYAEKLSKRLEAMQADMRASSRANKADSKKKEYEARRAKFYDIKIGETPALTLFLDSWKKEYQDYFLDENNKKEAEKKYRDKKKEYEDFCEEHKNTRYGSDDYLRRKELSTEVSNLFARYDLFTRTPERIYDDSTILAKEIEADFINSISKYCEKIKDASLHFEQGKLNGIITGEDGRKWRVETIVAGGVVQRAHLRTLVHEIRI